MEVEHYLFKVIKTPDGEAPEHVREGWVDCELVGFKLPETENECGLLTNKSEPGRGGYAAYKDLSLAVLKSKDPYAAHWFKRHIPSDLPFLAFGPDEVEILESLPSSLVEFFIRTTDNDNR